MMIHFKNLLTSFSSRVKFNRHELAGSLGDLGTDLPLIMAMISAISLDTASTFIMFGLMQIVTGFLYGLPMPMQPLKAMAVLVITQKISPGVLYGGGLSIGIVMLLLTMTGLLDVMIRLIPLHVVRGIQLGLALTLIKLSFFNYIPSLGFEGYVLSFLGGLLILLLRKHKRLPVAFVLVFVGLLFSWWKNEFKEFSLNPSLHFPKGHRLTTQEIIDGFFMLALAQLPLSLSNSVIATHQTIKDLFPDKKVSVKQIGFTYSLFNLAAPWFSGIPACHGCGGLAGHYAFGARSGGSVVTYGLFYLVIGLIFADHAQRLVEIFPLPLLGVMLAAESLVLAKLSRDIMSKRFEFLVALLVAVIAVMLPHGYMIGLIIGILISKMREV
jgi:hypothetical protein